MMLESLTPRAAWRLPPADLASTHLHLQDLCTHIPDEWLNYSLSEQESRSRMRGGGAPMHAKGCPPSPQRPVAECPPLGPVQKWV